MPNRFTGPLPLKERLLSKVEYADNGCWLWTDYKLKGYGRFNINQVTVLAHRAMYETLVGPIPQGMQLDHLCRNPSCVNPDHLEPVTNRENALRAYSLKTHCAQGHEYTPENIRWSTNSCGNPSRRCRACSRRWSTEGNRRARARAKAKAA